MKTIQLTFKQSKEVRHEQKEIRVNRGGYILYIQDSNYGLIARDWIGNVIDVNIKLDWVFE